MIIETLTALSTIKQTLNVISNLKEKFSKNNSQLNLVEDILLTFSYNSDLKDELLKEKRLKKELLENKKNEIIKQEKILSINEEVISERNNFWDKKYLEMKSKLTDLDFLNERNNLKKVNVNEMNIYIKYDELIEKLISENKNTKLKVSEKFSKAKVEKKEKDINDIDKKLALLDEMIQNELELFSNKIDTIRKETELILKNIDIPNLNEKFRKNISELKNFLNDWNNDFEKSTKKALQEKEKAVEAIKAINSEIDIIKNQINKIKKDIDEKEEELVQKISSTIDSFEKKVIKDERMRISKEILN